MQVAGRELGEPDLIQAVRLEGGVYRVRFGRSCRREIRSQADIPLVTGGRRER